MLARSITRKFYTTANLTHKPDTARRNLVSIIAAVNSLAQWSYIFIKHLRRHLQNVHGSLQCFIAMASWKKGSKIYNRSYVVEPQVVLDAIFHSEKFHWSWFEEQCGIVHHTGIVFYLDYEARFTVNWTPQSGTKRFGSLVLETEGQLVYEDELAKRKNDPKYNVDYKPFIQEYDLLSILHSEDDQKWNEFGELFKELSSFKFSKYENEKDDGNARFYDLTGCNCRDHVESVLRHVLNKNDPHLIKAISDIQQVRGRRWERFLYNAAAFKGQFVTAFRGILSWPSFDNFREYQRQRAKADGPFFDLSAIFSME